MDQIIEYYQKQFGAPCRHADFRSPEGVLLKVLKWDEEQSGEGVAIYATAGASNVLGDSDEGCEFFLELTPQVDDVVNALAEAALHGIGTRQIPASGDSITLSYKLWQGTDARSFLFTDGNEIISPVKIGQKSLKFVQLIPVFNSELSYKKRNGEVALWERFEEMTVPYWNSTRKVAF